MFGKIFLRAETWISVNIWIVHQMAYVERNTYILHLVRMVTLRASLATVQLV
jgi:hypothetical protein